MTILSLLKTIPPGLRRRGLLVALSVPLRALLDFAGLAALLPVLMMVLGDGGITSNRYMAAVYDYFDFSSPGTFATAICATALAIILIKNLLTLLLARSQSRYMLSVYRYFSLQLFRTYYLRGLGFIKGRGATRLMHEVNYVCYAFAMNVLLPILTVCGEASFLALLFAALLFYDPLTAMLMAACFVPVLVLYMRLVKGRLEKYGRLENTARRRQSSVAYQAYRGYNEMEICGAMPLLEKRFTENLKDISRARRRTDTLLRIPAALSEAAVAMVILVIVASSTSLEATRLLFGVFAVAALRLLPSVRAILGGWAQIRNNLYTAQTIAEGLDQMPDSDQDDGSPLPFHHTLKAEHITFAYADDERPVLENFSMTVAWGERIGIRGTSGGGKTTLFNLLLGFFTPQKGIVTIDGVPLDRKTRRAWQNTIGYVPQEVFIADDTLAGNIALGDGHPDRDKVEKILAQVQLSQWYEKLPQGLDTPMGENGARLSGGQKQRIGIARALYKGATVLFFDEATSSLDNDTEKEITRAIAELSAARTDLTILVIAHRDSSLSFCDRIIEL